MAGSLFSGTPRLVSSVYNVAVTTWVLSLLAVLFAVVLHAAGA